MQKLRRKDDAEEDDHSEEREPFIDWERAAPRWALITVLVASFGLNGFLGTVTVGLIVNKLNEIEKVGNDPKWDMIARLATTQAEQGVKIKQHDDDLKQISILSARMADMQSDLKILSNRLERKGF